ncbi:MAG: helix-hairpin-helix domain-containing protein [Candidatus Competibacteraceae bacterium]|nr:helix-hairpin-helix domain-containing protein [Candidatus Competibacteraceae bacterium]
MRFLKIAFGFALALSSALSFAQAIDINAATAQQLDAIKGIGASKAAAIVKYRETNGPFGSVEDLAKVPGIKMKTVDNIRPFVTVNGGAPAPVRAMPATPANANALPRMKGPANPAVATPPAKIDGPANPAVSSDPGQIRGPRNPAVPREPPVMKGPANPAVMPPAR